MLFASLRSKSPSIYHMLPLQVLLIFWHLNLSTQPAIYYVASTFLQTFTLRSGPAQDRQHAQLEAGIPLIL